MSALDTAAGASGEDATASEALDRVVLRYLQRRGYKNAAGVLRTEARVHEHAINDTVSAESFAKGGMSVVHAMGADAAISDHLLYYAEAEADPRGLVDGYGALRDWAQNSLDMYKVCVACVCVRACVRVHCDDNSRARGFAARVGSRLVMVRD